MKIGITGHQNLGDQSTKKWVRMVLGEAVSKYRITQGFTCLAVGADQLYAEILKQRNIPYTAVIPSKNYERTFVDKSLYENFLLLLTHASNTVNLYFDEPSETAFFEAGKEVVNMSTVMFAVWNGKEAKGLGGTGDIVKYSLDSGKKVVHFNPLLRTVTEV